MPNTEEQRLDIIENCTLLLDGILKPFEQTDDTPEGRMITQLKWLKERAENKDLALPVDRGKLASLLYIYTNGDITHLARSKDTVREDVEIYMNRLISLANKGALLNKSPYYPMAITLIDALIHLLHTATRPLTINETRLDTELETLKQLLAEGKIEPPLMSYLPNYFNFNEVNMYKVSLEDQPNGKYLVKTIANLIFNGIRPDTWLIPEAAQKDIALYSTEK